MYFDMLGKKANLFPKWVVNSVTSESFALSLKDWRARKGIRGKKFKEIPKLEWHPELRFFISFQISST